MAEIIILIVFILLFPFFIYLIRGVPKNDYADDDNINDDANGDETEDTPKGMLQEIKETYLYYIKSIISIIISGLSLSLSIG